MELFSFFKKNTIDTLTFNISNSELKRKTKIVVIDDEEDSFPYKHLQDDGYTIEWWSKVDSFKLQRLENGDYDIIMLDIAGVADEDLSDTDGIGVLKRVKNVNKNQIVVAFSGQSYDLSKTEFWRLADETLSKPVTLIQCKELLDALICNKINIKNYWKAIKDILIANNVDSKKIKNIEREIISVIDSKKQFDESIFSGKFLSGVKNATSVITLINAILRMTK